MSDIKIINESQIKKIIIEKILKELNQNNLEDSYDEKEGQEDDSTIGDDVLNLFYEKCYKIITNNQIMSSVQKLYNQKKSLTDNLPFFNTNIKKEINKSIAKLSGFEKLSQDDENLKKYFTEWKQIPIDNYQKYTKFFKSISNGDKIDNNKQKEYNELILTSKFKILLNGNKKKICIMLDNSESEYIRHAISDVINEEGSSLYISKQKSYYTGDEDWIDYFEGDEGDGFTAVTSLVSPGVAKNQTKKIGSFIKNKVKDAFKPIDVAEEVLPNKVKGFIPYTESYVKSYKKTNKLNEVLFIPVLKFIGSFIAWSIADAYFNKHLIVPNSNWIESRKLYVFDYQSGDIPEVDNIINNYQSFIEKLKKAHGGTDPTEITDQIIDVFIYFLQNLESFCRKNKLPLMNDRKKIVKINNDITFLKNISNSNNKMYDFRKFLKLDNSKKSKPSISLLKNFKKIVNERNIDLEKESTENITNEIYQYYLEKFNESKNN